MLPFKRLSDVTEKELLRPDPFYRRPLTVTGLHQKYESRCQNPDVHALQNGKPSTLTHRYLKLAELEGKKYHATLLLPIPGKMISVVS